MVRGCKGYPVINPCELDQSAPYTELMRRDLLIICAAVDAGAMLEGWQDSVGARRKAELLSFIGKPLYDARTLAPIEFAERELVAA